MLTVTRTRTHVYVEFADPYLVCEKCRAWVTAYHDGDRCGCQDTWWNVPCGCERAGITTLCPSWSPVDGCECQAHLGHVPHPEP